MLVGWRASWGCVKFLTSSSPPPEGEPPFPIEKESWVLVFVAGGMGAVAVGEGTTGEGAALPAWICVLRTLRGGTPSGSPLSSCRLLLLLALVFSRWRRV